LRFSSTFSDAAGYASYQLLCSTARRVGVLRKTRLGSPSSIFDRLIALTGGLYDAQVDPICAYLR
jgi:hypothetical protein